MPVSKPVTLKVPVWKSAFKSLFKVLKQGDLLSIIILLSYNGDERGVSKMLITVKRISRLLNEENAPIKYYNLDERNGKDELFYFLALDQDSRKEYDALAEEKQKKICE